MSNGALLMLQERGGGRKGRGDEGEGGGEDGFCVGGDNSQASQSEASFLRCEQAQAPQALTHNVVTEVLNSKTVCHYSASCTKPINHTARSLKERLPVPL